MASAHVMWGFTAWIVATLHVLDLYVTMMNLILNTALIAATMVILIKWMDLTYMSVMLEGSHASKSFMILVVFSLVAQTVFVMDSELVNVLPRLLVMIAAS